ARDPNLDRDVALKSLPELYVTDETLVARFLRESKIAASLIHPNIVVVHEWFVHDGVPYISMEYVGGGSLRPLIGTLDVRQAAGAVHGILAGLAYAAREGVVHRDLKPENLLVS